MTVAREKLILIYGFSKKDAQMLAEERELLKPVIDENTEYDEDVVEDLTTRVKKFRELQAHDISIRSRNILSAATDETWARLLAINLPDQVLKIMANKDAAPSLTDFQSLRSPLEKLRHLHLCHPWAQTR